MDDEDKRVKEVRLNQLARNLKQEYARQREIRDRRPYRPHKRYDSTAAWLDTAKLCDSLNATPEDFIAAQFKMRIGTIFANTLSGPSAERAYKEFCRTMDLTTTGSPGEVWLLQRIAAHRAQLQHSTGSSDMCSSAAIAAILHSPWHYDPLTVMLTSGFDEKICEEFRDMAVRELEEEPFLKAAARRLNFDVDAFL